MKLDSLKCPSCGANYNPAKIQCDYCQSYVIISNEKYVDFSQIEFDDAVDNEKYKGIYVYGTLLGKGEKPINFGAANYYKGLFNVGGKLLLTNKTLSFSSHKFMQGKTDLVINISDIESATVESNMLISQTIAVVALGKKHRFVVYHGKEWIEKIMDIKNNKIVSKSDDNYIEELKKLKELLDEGIISQEEFDIKKRMLLKL